MNATVKSQYYVCGRKDNKANMLYVFLAAMALNLFLFC